VFLKTLKKANQQLPHGAGVAVQTASWLFKGFLFVCPKSNDHLLADGAGQT
jgi:hypothetical protein